MNRFIVTGVGLMLALAPSLVGAQTLDTSSPGQLAISSATLDGHCPPGQSEMAFSTFQRTLIINGNNFDVCGSVPVVTLGWGAGQKTYTPAYGSWNANQIVIPIQCSDFSPAGSYRLMVATGQGMPCRDGVSFHFNLRGPNGSNGKDGTNGSNGKDGATGPQGPTGNNGNNGRDGATGPQGPTGNNGNNGRDGATGPQGATGPKGPTGPNGPNGPTGPQGPAGKALGWHKKLTSTPISGTTAPVLSQTVTGSNAYMVDAKINAPFANGQTQITCTLVAVENGVSTEIDRLDMNLPGSGQSVAKGGIALDGAYTAAGGAAASVTINVNCVTGGDTRTLTNGRMNIVGVDSLVQ